MVTCRLSNKQSIYFLTDKQEQHQSLKVLELLMFYRHIIKIFFRTLLMKRADLLKELYVKMCYKM